MSFQEQKNNLLKQINALHERHELAGKVGPDYFEPGMMEYLDKSDGFFDPASGEIMLRFEARGTRYEGRTEEIERVKEGDEIRVVRDKENAYNANNFTLLTKKDKSVGNMPAELCDAIAPLYDSGSLTLTDAKVSFVDPLSKRNRHAKQAVLFVELNCRIEEEQKVKGEKGNMVVDEVNVSKNSGGVKHSSVSVVDFDGMVKFVQGLSDDKINALVKDCGNKIRFDMPKAFPDRERGIKQLNYVYVLGVTVGCMGLDDVSGKKDLLMELLGDDMDEATVLGLVKGYDDKYLKIILRVMRLFSSTIAIKEMMLYMIGIACYRGVNQKALDKLRLLHEAWINHYGDVNNDFIEGIDEPKKEEKHWYHAGESMDDTDTSSPSEPAAEVEEPEEKEDPAEAKQRKAEENRTRLKEIAEKTKADAHEIEAEWKKYISDFKEKDSWTPDKTERDINNDRLTISKKQTNVGAKLEKLVLETNEKARPLVTDDSAPDGVKAVADALDGILAFISNWTVEMTIPGRSLGERIGSPAYLVSVTTERICQWWKDTYNGLPGIMKEKCRIELQSRIEKDNKKIEDLNENNTQLEAKLSHMAAETNQNKTAYDNALMALDATIRSIKDNYEGAIADEEKAAENARADYETLQSRLDKDKAELEGLSVFKLGRKKELSNEIGSLERYIPDTKKKVEEHEAELTRLQKERDSKIEKAKNSVTELHKKWLSGTTDYRIAENRHSEILSDIEKYEKDRKEFQGKLDHLEEENIEKLAAELELNTVGKEKGHAPHRTTVRLISDYDRRNIPDKKKILSVLASRGESTSGEIAVACGFASPQKASSLMVSMIRDGKIIRTETDGKYYFKLAE